MKISSKSVLALLAFTAALGIAPTIKTHAAQGWVSNSGKWLYYDNNGSVHKGWIQTSDGYYYMDLSL